MFKLIFGISVLLGLGYLVYQIVQVNKLIFLDKSDTATFLYEDSDGYISNMSYLDLLARQCKSHKEYLLKAKNAALSFTPEQESLIETCFENAFYYLRYVHKSSYINTALLDSLKVRFAYVDTSYENGLPHTRDNIIFLSTNTLKQSKEQLTVTILHEFIHIYQRVYQTEFREALLKEGYTIWRKRSQYPRVRSNPDLDDTIYMHPKGFIMVTIYASNSPTSISDVINPDDYEYEHPNEEIAHEIANGYLKRSL